MKRTIVINDVLRESIDEAIEGVKTELLSYLEQNPDTDELPCKENDLNYSGAVHEIIDGAVPIWTSDINAIFFLYGDEVEAAFDNAGIGEKEDKGWPSGWKPAAIYCYIEEKVNDWWNSNADDIFTEWQEAKAAKAKDAAE